MKKILSLILISIIGITAYGADSDWKIHPIFDEEVTHVVETPDYVYFTSYHMSPEITSREVYLSLFRYDKKGEELLPLSVSNILNGNSIRDVIYNPGKGYLLVLYKDFQIDLLYNNGNVKDIPYYQQSNITYNKGVNSMTIDEANDRVYLATEFGYVALNDKKNEIAESRIYGEPLQAFCRVGDKYIALKDDDLLIADVATPRLNLDQYEILATYPSPSKLYPLGGDIFLLVGGEKGNQYLKKLTLNDDGLQEENYNLGTIHNIENTASGVVVANNTHLYQFDKEGKMTSLTRPENFKNSSAVTTNMSDVWVGVKRKGLSRIKKNGEAWNVTQNWMSPNSPATYATTSFVNHPTYGFLMLDYGYQSSTLNLSSYSPLQLSGLKQGRWKNYAPAYTNPLRGSIMTASNGMAVDPEKKEYVYITSYHEGILRLNLNNPNDILHMSYPRDDDRGNPGFVEMPGRPTTNAKYANISPLNYDKNGNLWMAYADWDDSDDPNPHLYCWLASDRKASTDASNVQFPRIVEVKEYMPLSNQINVLPLLKTGNGLLAFTNGQYSEELLLIDTNGTPTDNKDDKVYRFTSYIDSDGNSIELRNAKFMWEDPFSGNVWVGHQNGVCYFSPSQVRTGNYTINRVKVSRNDGTNLADYLLEGVTVNHMVSDSENRKWFATAGGGVICTSYDGREIVEEFNTSNSPLPSDVVYGIGYNSENNSLMFSTAEGYAEYFLPANQDSSEKSDIKAYPNPVRPEYSGYVTISDIPQGSFVKITDVKGNLVKDLGVMNGFEMLWDISDSNFNRVKSGVYHIMVSPSSDSTSYSGVGKILVIS